MAMRSRTRQSDIPLSTLGQNTTVSPATVNSTTDGSSTAVPPPFVDPALPSQGGPTVKLQSISAGHARPSSHDNGATAASAVNTPPAPARPTAAAAHPKPEYWNWTERVGLILGILGTFVAIIYFVFPYRAAVTANQLATTGIAVANVANGWTRWAQCTAPGSMIANATWCRNHPTPDTFDKDFNNVRRSILDAVLSGFFGYSAIVEALDFRLLCCVLVTSIGVILFLMRNKYARKESMPIWLAAKEGHNAVVKKLLAKGVDPDSYDDHHRTGLWFDALGGHEANVRMLLQKGANTEFRGWSGATALQFQKPATALQLVSEHGHGGIARFLLDYGDDPWSTEKYRLHYVELAKRARLKRAAEKVF